MLVNCTPHTINIIRQGGESDLVLPPDANFGGKNAPRCTPQRTPVSHPVCAMRLSVVRTVLGDVTGLPPVVEGTYYVVSALVAQMAMDRHDLMFPGEAARDAEGKIIGCLGLCVP